MILRGQDNKVLRDVSGEVLEQSDAIIDLRSTFGVTKNASNEVSQVKLYNNPSQVFRAHVGNEPIEQGNGFEFDGVSDYLISSRPYFDFATGYLFCSVWMKKNAFLGVKKLFEIADHVNSSSGSEFVFDWSGNAIRVQLSINGAITNTHTVSYLPTDIGTWAGNWHHVGMISQYTSGTTHLFGFTIDGFLQAKRTLAYNPPKSNTPLIFGARYSQYDQVFDGNMDDLYFNTNQLYDLNNFVNGDFLFTPPKRSSE